MADLEISLTIAGDTATSVQLQTLTDAVTGISVATAAGVTLPASFTSGGDGSWTLDFTDTGLASYAYTFLIHWGDGTSDPGSGTKSGNAVANSPPLTLARATSILSNLYTAAQANPGGVNTVTVDGQTVVYNTPAALNQAIAFWEKRVALLSGRRRRATTIRMDRF